MQELLKISQQTFWQIIGKVVTSVSTIIILGIVARNYGEKGTGVFTLALTYLAIFYLLADFGFNADVLRKFSIFNLACRQTGFQFSIEWRKLLGTRIIWSMALAALAAGLLPLWPASPRGEPFATPVFSQAVLFGGLAIIGNSIFNTCNLIFQSKLKYERSVVASSIGTVVGLIVTVWLISARQPVSYLILGHLTGWMAIAAVSLILVKALLKNNDRKGPLFDLSYTVNLFKDCWPIAATLTLNVIYFRVDSFMIAYFKGVSDVGIYNIAYSVFQSVLVIPTFIMNSYFPLMLNSLKGFKLVGLGLFLLSLLASSATLLFTPVIIKILTGGGFFGSIQSLQILSLGFPAYFLSSLLMWLMITKARYKLMLVIYLTGLLINVILNAVYIPQFSFLAAAWITVISEYLILGMQTGILLFEEYL